MKNFSSLEKKSYIFEELYKLCKFSSVIELAEALLCATHKGEIKSFVIVKLPFDMFKTNISFQFETIAGIPDKVKIPFSKELIQIYPEYVEVRFKIL